MKRYVFNKKVRTPPFLSGVQLVINAYGNYNLGDKGNKTKKDCCGKGQDLKGEVGPEGNGYQGWKTKLYNDGRHQI